MGWIKRIAAVLLGLSLAACGGGGGSAGAPPFGSGGGGGGGGGTTPQPTVTVSLSTSTVTGATPAVVTARVRDEFGSNVAGQVVQFSTAGGLGKFSANSALTDASGIAAVNLEPATQSTTGADEVVVSTTLNGQSVSGRAGFQLSATQVTIASFVSDATTLSAYGQANLTVALAGFTAGTPVGISVISACVNKGKASLTPTSATTSTGAATFTYRDNGCGATDLADTLQASVTGTTTTASLQIGLTSPTVSSITFTGATPQVIYLRGTGLNETSQVVFQVRDAAGNGLANQSVTLEMVALSGDVTLDGGSVPVTKLSDSQGNVSVRINAGTIPTSVRVKATLQGPSGPVSTVSSALAVAVGLPSQLNFSLSQQTKNIEGMNIDGTPNTYQIIASDRLGNPVPDGTAMNFITEGGQVEAIQFTQTVAGIARATANFVSSEPRPVDGRVTVLTYALGEESFLDANGNNTFDASEDYQDLGNVFLDRNFDGTYNTALDQLIPLNISGSAICHTPSATSASLLNLDKTIPSIPNTCVAGWGRAHVRRATETVFSTSAARPLWPTKRSDQFTGSVCATTPLLKVSSDDPIADIQDASKVDTYYRVAGSSLYNLGGVGVISFYVSDANGYRLNPMAAGTTISATATDGLSVTVAGGSPVPSTTEATFASVSYKFDTAVAGTITLSFRSPSGLTTDVPIFVDTRAPGGGLVPCP
jgi:hypothetical protein